MNPTLAACNTTLNTAAFLMTNQILMTTIIILYLSQCAEYNCGRHNMQPAAILYRRPGAPYVLKSSITKLVVTFTTIFTLNSDEALPPETSNHTSRSVVMDIIIIITS